MRNSYMPRCEDRCILPAPRPEGREAEREDCPRYRACRDDAIRRNPQAQCVPCRECTMVAASCQRTGT